MDILVGIILIVFGVSFGWKCIEAVFMGRVTYWTGFLPLGIFSPLFIHTPPGKNSLIKTVHGMWVHLIPGPIFFFISLIMISTGMDRVGLPGTEWLNQVLTLGQKDIPAAITYSKDSGYKVPILFKTKDALIKLITTHVSGEDDLEKINQPH